jgi:fumarate reductase flavoprotein subunit
MGDRDHETDLIVVGAGLAGLVASIVAAEEGLHVVLLEKQSSTGGSSALSGGCLAFAGTDLQANLNIDDSAERLFNDLREVGKFENDEQLVRLYTDNQLATYHWLKAKGVLFGQELEASSGQSVPRSHNVDPADMIRVLTAHAEQNPNIDVVFNARTLRLLTSDDGQVAGVQYERDANSGVFLYAGHGVLLTSGGFCRNPDLVHRYAPQYDDAICIGGEGNVGDGLRMALKLGADMSDMAYIKGTFGKHPTDHTNHHSMLAVYKGAIAINQLGNRFVDESISYKLLGDAVIQQPYGASFQIFDQRIMNSGDNRFRILDFERRHEAGLLYEANSLEALAQQIEVPVDAMVRTIQHYNKAVEDQFDPDFGRTALVQGLGALVKIEQPPFYAFPSSVAVFGTYCGLKVNERLQVVDVFNEPIEGLFAAGEVVGGLHGAAYMTGSALGKAAIFGRMAALQCAGMLSQG